MWFWLAMIAGLASALDKVLNRVALKNRGNVIAHSFLYISVISLFSLAFSFPIKNIQVTNHLIFLIIIQAFFWSTGTLVSFLSQAKTDVSLSMIISRARMLWVVPLGIIFLGETPSIPSVVGILIIFFGLLTLFIKSNIHRHQGVHLMAIGSVLVAFGAVINTVLVRQYLTSAQTVFVTMASQALVFLAFLLYRKNLISRCYEVWMRAWKIIVLAAAVETFAFIGVNHAYKIGITSFVTAVYLGMTITTVWIGIFFLNEKEHFWKKIIGSLLVTVGIIVLKFSG